MRFPRPFRIFAAAAAAFSLWACLNDGPNRTGTGYLRDEGLRLTVPLHHFRFNRFPIDDVIGVETPLNHISESLLVVGREGPFRATARLGFQVTTKSHRDSIALGLHLQLRALPRTMPGYAFLKNSSAGLDSITLLVEAFAWPDTSKARFTDSLTAFHRRIITSPAPFSTLEPTFRVRDTARIALAATYRDSLRDSLQYAALPNLRARLQTDTSQWIVYLEASPLPGAADSGLFRFDGGSYSGSGTALLLGTDPQSDSGAPTTLSPYLTLGYFPALNYQVFHSGLTQSLLYGVSRGLHLKLNRQTLLDSIAGRLGGLAFFLKQYDTRFFVPYGEIRLPLADSLVKVDGPFALDMRMNSDVDSAAVPGELLSDAVPVALDSTVKLLYSFSVADAGQTAPLDSLYCHYQKHPADSALRRAIFSWRGGDSTARDTFTLIPDRRNWELGLRRGASESRTRFVTVTPDSGLLSLTVFYSTGSVIEPNGFLDSAGNPLTAAADLQRRYFRPGAGELTVRATRGLRALLNRNTDATCSPSPCADVAPDLFLMPADRNAYDTSGYVKIPYPVLGEIDFPRTGGKVEATVDIYLYPLRSAP